MVEMSDRIPAHVGDLKCSSCGTFCTQLMLIRAVRVSQTLVLHEKDPHLL